jgi:hypothetical protein
MTSTADKLMIELGYISMHLSNFDYLINEIIPSLINWDNNNIGNYFSSKLKTTHARMEIYKDLLKITPFQDDLIEDAKNNIVGFDKLRKRRNELIHGIWYTKEENEITLDEFYLGKLNTDWNTDNRIDLNELKQLKESLVKLIQKQVEINSRILVDYRRIIEEDLERKERGRKLLKKIIDSVEPEE